MAIPSDGAATQTISDADGNALRRVEFTDSSAEWISGGDRYQAPLEDALAYRAAYALFHALLGSGPVEPERATHGGGDELVRLAADGALLECTLLETLRLKLGEHASASYQFGADDHWLRRIVVRDQPTGFVVTLTFGDVREWSGLRFPTVVEAESEKGTFREVLTDIHREGG